MGIERVATIDQRGKTLWKKRLVRGMRNYDQREKEENIKDDGVTIKIRPPHQTSTRAGLPSALELEVWRYVCGSFMTLVNC